MNHIVTGIGVDAGIIMVADMDYLKTVQHDRKELKRLGKTLQIPKGSYHITWRIRNSWNGDIKGEANLRITSGKIFICDPCYIIGKPEHKDWLAWLEATNYGKALNNDQAFIIDEMGGDGVYTVELNFIKQA